MKAVSFIVWLSTMMVGAFSADSHAQTATANMRFAVGHSAGILHLEETHAGVLISGRLHGFVPGAHGMHIHDHGVCDPSTGFETAGPHYNPEKKPHGYLTPGGHHAGDLPNVLADENGIVDIEVILPVATLKVYVNPDAETLLTGTGTSIVIDEGSDDYISQPSGHTGSRLACGVIVSD